MTGDTNLLEIFERNSVVQDLIDSAYGEMRRGLQHRHHLAMICRRIPESLNEWDTYGRGVRNCRHSLQSLTWNRTAISDIFVLLSLVRVFFSGQFFDEDHNNERWGRKFPAVFSLITFSFCLNMVTVSAAILDAVKEMTFWWKMN